MSTGVVRSRLGSLAPPAASTAIHNRQEAPTAGNLGALAGTNSFDYTNRGTVPPTQAAIMRVLTTPLSSSVATEFAGMNVGPAASREENITAIRLAHIKAYGREPDQGTVDYWLRKFDGTEHNDSGYVSSGQMSSTEYWYKRLIGWQAGGRDVASFGPWAGSGSGGPNGNGRVPGSGPASSFVLASLAENGMTADGLYTAMIGSMRGSSFSPPANTDATYEVQRRRRGAIAA